MRAALLRDIPASALQVADVPDITPVRPDDLLLRVEACGICGTDLHLMDGQSFHPELPFILGHEPVGTVVAVGSSELEGWLGTRVTATIFVGCGRCSMCQAEAERLCPNLRAITGLLHAAGGYAEYLVIRASQAVEVPSALSSEAAASLTDAGPTAVNAVRAALTREPSQVVIVGAGPVGFLCAELLHLAGRDFVVVEPNALRRDALSQGGYRVVSQLDEVPTSPDAVIDCAAAPGVVPWALHQLSARGVFVAVGFQTVPNFELIPIVRKEIALLGIRSGSRDDLIRSLDLAATRRIRIPSVRTWPLDGINEALNALRTGQVEGKAVVVFLASDRASFVTGANYHVDGGSVGGTA